MSRRHSRAAAATFALLAGTIGTTVAAHATAPPVTDLYVNGAGPTCSDAGSGTPFAPFCTIQAAADVVEPGQTVHVAATLGSYAPFTISRSGTAEAPITFVSAPSANYAGITEPLVKGIPTAGPSVAITVSGAQYVSFSGINTVGIDRSALQLLGSSHVSYDQATIYSSGGRSATAPSTAVIDGASSDVTLSKDDFSEDPGWAIDAQSGASGLVITDDYLEASSLGGIRADGVTGVTVTADSIDGLCGSAVDITGASSGSIENVIAVGSGESADSAGFCSARGTSAEINVDAQAAPNVQSDYNDVHTNAYGSDYVWAGLAYPSPAAFTAATGQGVHDLGANVVPDYMTEGSPVIDSGDADAPDEPATDLQNLPRADDPLVANTGTGDGYVDRGAYEFQNPLTISDVAATPSEGPAPLQTTLTTVVSNPWNTQGVRYSFNPGDDAGWPPNSAEPSATWTYATIGLDSVTATAYLPDGTTRTASEYGAVDVNAPGPLVAAVTYSTSDMQPDAASFSFPSTSPWPITNNVVNYGDRSPTAQFSGNETELNHTYAAPGTYTVTDTVTDAGGRTETATKQVTVGLAFVGITPQRVLDTRYGTGAPEKPVGPAGLVRVKVAGVDGIPADASAVTMNVTDTGATATSYVTAYADGSARPKASALNFGPGQINPNLITVPVGQDGYVDLWNAAGDVELFADVQGYYTSQDSASAVQSGFTASGPTRVLDTRYGTGAAKRPVGPGGVITLTLPAAYDTADDVVLNVTETGATAASYVTAYPGTGTRPTASNLNFSPRQTTSNLLVVPLTPGGPKTVRLYNSAGSVNLIADVQGYYSNDADSPYVPISPTRVVDTRYGTGAPQKPIGPGAKLRVKVAGVGGIPLGATSVLVNITGTEPTASTYLTAFGAGTAPGTSNIDLVPGQTRPVLAAVPVDSQGYITIQNAQGDIEVFADIEGYFG